MMKYYKKYQIEEKIDKLIQNIKLDPETMYLIQLNIYVYN